MTTHPDWGQLRDCYPADCRQLDKPLLIGEFQAKGFANLEENPRLKTPLTTEEAYIHAIKTGYAGCLG